MTCEKCPFNENSHCKVCEIIWDTLEMFGRNIVPREYYSKIEVVNDTCIIDEHEKRRKENNYASKQRQTKNRNHD